MVRRDPSGQKPTVESTQGATSVAAMLESVVGCKWSVRVLEILARGRSRPSQILRECPGLSAKVMNERLRKLMRYGIVERSVYGEKPPVRVEYALTPFGRRFIEIVEAVRRLQEEIDRAQGGPR